MFLNFNKKHKTCSFFIYDTHDTNSGCATERQLHRPSESPHPALLTITREVTENPSAAAGVAVPWVSAGEMCSPSWRRLYARVKKSPTGAAERATNERLQDVEKVEYHGRGADRFGCS